MRRSSIGFSFIAAIVAAFTSVGFAADYAVPQGSDAVIGEIYYISSSHGDTPVTVAQRYNLGLNSIVDANPGFSENSYFNRGTYVKVPTEFILPPLPRKGIVINLPEMRLYYYPPGTAQVMTFPIGIGKMDKTIPIKNTSIVRKATNPYWHPTPAIIEFNREQGIELPSAMPPGPDNPLGPYAIYTGLPTYLIHSTIFPESIGRRASFGCIRMNESDIKQFFPIVAAGTPVAIIDMPAKVGWSGNNLFLQAHPPLEERASNIELSSVVDQIQYQTEGRVTLINWQLVSYLASQPDGVPHEIGFIP